MVGLKVMALRLFFALAGFSAHVYWCFSTRSAVKRRPQNGQGTRSSPGSVSYVLGSNLGTVWDSVISYSFYSVDWTIFG